MFWGNPGLNPPKTQVLASILLKGVPDSKCEFLDHRVVAVAVGHTSDMSLYYLTRWCFY